MKIVVTGSHFTPAQAVIEELLRNSNLEIVYFGRKYARDDDKAASAESKILPKLGVKFIPLTAGRFNRFFSFYSLLSLLKTPIGFVQSFYYLVKEKPDLIVSFGGFTGMPVVICGWLLSIPSLIHEQSLKMGLANRISSLFADRIALSFDKFKPAYIDPKKIVITGNPIRTEFLSEKSDPSPEIKSFIQKAAKKSKPIILITAGNQGSHKINLTIEDKLDELTKIATIIHQTGDSKYDDFNNLQKYSSENYFVKKWIDGNDLSFILDKTDLAISRGGINTLIELALKEVPSLMIPIPVGKEQLFNVRFFSKLGLGDVLIESDLTPEKLLIKLREMLDKKPGLKHSAKLSAKEITIDAQKRLVLEILLLQNKIENYSFEG